MISADSLLKNLPTALDRKQALYLDGIRHSAEIGALAYNRLKLTLTNIARMETHPEGHEFTEAFLDAWSVVDAIDRFRALWKLQPFADNLPLNELGETIDQEFRGVRDLRNLADHLAQRVDYVLSKNGTALGSLKWLTMLENGDFRGCIIVPGTFRPTEVHFSYPIGKTIEVPTGFIVLSAAGYSTVLGEALASMESHIRTIENLLGNELDKHGLRGSPAGADLLFRATIDFGNNVSRSET
jgi:hypothetical protein